jgi:Lactoylglutathione lyase and related lyases
MLTDTPGIHHITGIVRDAQQNVDFYTDTLGLRLVKQTVNLNDQFTRHLFYGDETGSPGTSLTFFAYP